MIAVTLLVTLIPKLTSLSDMQGEGMENRDDRSPELPGVLHDPGLEGDDHELSGYVQESFDFLDHIDCSVSNQVCVCACTAAIGARNLLSLLNP